MVPRSPSLALLSTEIFLLVLSLEWPLIWHELVVFQTPSYCSCKYYQKLFLTLCMIILSVRPCITNSFLSLLNSQLRPTPRAPLPPLPLCLHFTHPRWIEGYLDISFYFFPFLTASHCLSLFTFPLKPIYSSFLFTTGPLSLPLFSFSSELTTHIVLSMERSNLH